jgi:hypothetical protein
LIPATRQQIELCLAQAIDLFGTPKGWEQQFKLYCRLLGDLPPDLLARGVFIALQDGVFFPKPAEIRAPVKDELGGRKLTAVRLEVALSRVKAVVREAERPPPTDEEKRRVDELLARCIGRVTLRRERPVERTMTAADRRLAHEAIAARPKIPLPGTTGE